MGRPISLDKHKGVVEAFIDAIKEDSRSWGEFERWKSNGEVGEAPEYTDTVGVLALRFSGLGMPVDDICNLREAAYQIVEAAEQEQQDA